ncbi:MAG: hypothetical protein L0Y72_02020 [Gemmataceae bacterium]|nr:hypothetical protein [Gemmataceae bacterium]MCI0737793.1 hypothetical protein [Gemmataceae bacterium]
MRIPLELTGLLAIASAVAVTWAQEPAKTTSQLVVEKTVDLTKIERKILKEPAHQTKKQEYCLLVFGPEAKLHVWLVLDGNTLYVDRNGNGDLTDPGERVGIGIHGSFPAGDIDDPIGKSKHVDLVVFPLRKNPATIDIRSAGNYRQTCYPKYGSRPSEAPIIHFNGPVTLKMHKVHERLSKFGIGKAGILRRDREAHVEGYLGTPGLGEESYAYYDPRKLAPDGLTVEFEFPTGQKPVDFVRTKGLLKPDFLMLDGYLPVPRQVQVGTINIKAYLPDRKDIQGVPFTIPNVKIRD